MKPRNFITGRKAEEDVGFEPTQRDERLGRLEVDCITTLPTLLLVKPQLPLRLYIFTLLAIHTC